MRFTAKQSSVLLGGLFLLAAAGCTPTPGDLADEQREPHFLQGKSRLQSYDYAGAIESFERALEVNPRSAAAHFELGVLHDQRANDPTTAAYHYQRFLRLRPESPLAENVRQRILVCKQTLASEVSLGPVTQSIQREIEQLAAENTRLRQRATELEEILARRATNVSLQPAQPRSAPTTSVGGGAPRNGSSAAGLNSSVTGLAEQPLAAAPRRTHKVQSGDTLMSIARRYGVQLQELKSANPGLDERKLQIGKSLTIPAR